MRKPTTGLNPHTDQIETIVAEAERDHPDIKLTESERAPEPRWVEFCPLALPV